jgi:hypothetical protein
LFIHVDEIVVLELLFLTRTALLVRILSSLVASFRGARVSVKHFLLRPQQASRCFVVKKRLLIFVRLIVDFYQNFRLSEYIYTRAHPL